MTPGDRMAEAVRAHLDRWDKWIERAPTGGDLLAHMKALNDDRVSMRDALSAYSSRTVEDERREFERIVGAAGYVTDRIGCQYPHENVRFAWLVWCAARGVKP